MASKIHIVRHAESAHNISKDFGIPDPELTTLGQHQAQTLESTFPYSDTVGLIITSPLRRAIETTLLAFPRVLDKRYYAKGSGDGIENGAKLSLDPDLQERSDLPCDTGSDQHTLETLFPRLDFSTLRSEWLSKEGDYSADNEAVIARARKVRERVREESALLKESTRRDIVIVTHGVFMKFLVGHQSIDLPKAGWKSYTIESTKEGDSLLVSV